MSIQFLRTFKVIKREFEKREDGEFHYVNQQTLFESGSFIHGFPYCSVFLKKLLGYWVYETEIEFHEIKDGKLIHGIKIQKDTNSIQWRPKKYFEGRVGLRAIEDSQLWLTAYKRSRQLNFEHNFVRIPFDDGNRYFAYGIESKTYIQRPDGEWI